MAHNEFKVVGRKNAATAIKRFRTAVRAGDCAAANRAFVFIDGNPEIRRKIRWQLQDQLRRVCPLPDWRSR